MTVISDDERKRREEGREERCQTQRCGVEIDKVI
jgi:hypothetical protein